jgi:hypothetical protein
MFFLIRFSFFILFFSFFSLFCPCIGNDAKKLYIFVHGTEKYTFYSLFNSTAQTQLTKERWLNVKNKKIEQPGLINITNIDDPRHYNLEKNYGLLETLKKYRDSDSLFFIFNWDGELSNKSRRNASKKLAKEIINLKKKYENAELYIIGYSHGGNVAAQIADFIPKNSGITIDYFIMLGTPIGDRTEKWLMTKKIRGDYFFNHVYNAYSSSDFTQIKDLFFNFPLCRRYIKIRKKNVTNMKIAFVHDDKVFPDSSFIYSPNHRDFWRIHQDKHIKNNIFYFYPFIYYLFDILKDIQQKKMLYINTNQKKNISEVHIPLIPIK